MATNDKVIKEVEARKNEIINYLIKTFRWDNHYEILITFIALGEAMKQSNDIFKEFLPPSMKKELDEINIS